MGTEWLAGGGFLVHENQKVRQTRSRQSIGDPLPKSVGARDNLLLQLFYVICKSDAIVSG
jgi:hypothetical protein